GKHYARRFQTGWKDEQVAVSAEYNSVQPNFNPEVGFVRRKNMEQYSGDFSVMPQLHKGAVQSVNVGASVDYFGGSGSGKVETRVQAGTMGIRFENGGSATFVMEQTFDRLVSALRIPSGNAHVAISV